MKKLFEIEGSDSPSSVADAGTLPLIQLADIIRKAIEDLAKRIPLEYENSEERWSDPLNMLYFLMDDLEARARALDDWLQYQDTSDFGKFVLGVMHDAKKLPKDERGLYHDTIDAALKAASQGRMDLIERATKVLKEELSV